MPQISQLSNDIKEKVNSGIYIIDINLNEYTNTERTEIVMLPAELEQINFKVLNDYSTVYKIRIIARDERNKNLVINMDNVKINSGSYSAIDIRGVLNQTYTSTINYSGVNNIKSEEAVAIYVTNNQIIKINGLSSDSELNVSGGLGCCAIGNAPIFNYGGKIIFSGIGKVKAIGGDGSLSGKSSSSVAKDGGFAIGFADNTISPSSITIKCGPIIEAIGGKGQETNTDDPNSISAGNGGAGISLGLNGVLMIEECCKVNKSLIAIGGNGGEVSGTGAVQDKKNGGVGGDAISIISGKVIIENSVELQGGDGTSLKENNGDFSVVGGNGGSAIQANNNRLDIILDNGVLQSGNGGNGGSPSALGNEYIKGVTGAGSPGNGGNNGSVIDGRSDGTVKKKSCVNIISGIPGYGGSGLDLDGKKIVGKTGSELKPITLRVIESLEFGYINLKTKLDLCKCNNNTINSYLNPTSNIDKKKQWGLSIGQNFENCLNAELLNIQNYYNSLKPMNIYGDIFITLIVNSSINVCEKTVIPMIVKKDKK